MDLAKIKERTAHVWGLGDYTGISERLRPAAAAVRDACSVRAGQEVLDVAAGDGNFAIACARVGARVVASDLSPGMVERGRTRTADEGLEIEWLVADAEELPFEDGRFDCAGSVFGAMIAPRPEAAARELMRVVRSAGVAALTAWRPGRFPAEMFAVGRAYQPIPEGLPSPEEWGDEETARARLEPHAHTVRCERQSLTWTADSIDAFAAELDATPVAAAARETLDRDDYDQMRSETLAVGRRWAEQPDGSFAAEAEYLLTVATKP